MDNLFGEYTLWTILFALFFTSIFYLFLKKDSRVKKYVNKLPGPPTYPLFGNGLIMLKLRNHELLNHIKNWNDEYGGFFRMWLGNRAIFTCNNNAEILEKILSSTIHIDKSEDYEVLHTWLGTGLLTSGGQKWASRRKLLTPTFHFKILEEFNDVFNEQGRIFVDVLKTELGKEFDIVPYVARCTLDIICETAMGQKLHAQKIKNGSSYVAAISGINEILTQRILKVWLRPNWIWNLSPQGRAEKKYLRTLHQFTENIIKERDTARQTKKNLIDVNTDLNVEKDSPFESKKRMAFLDLLLEARENGNGLSDLDIREEVDTFMFEGHDTTAANLSFTIFLLATYQKHQKLVQNELDEIFGSDKRTNVTSKEVAQMKYLECCVKESLRLYPSVGFFLRGIKKDLVINDGQQIIPAGTTAFIAPYLTHRDAKVFPDPEKFDPDRFILENTVGRNPYAYIPFSAGPRNCIGQKFALMEIKIVLAHLLRNFDLEAVDKRENIRLVPDIILRPLDGLRIKISPRV